MSTEQETDKWPHNNRIEATILMDGKEAGIILEKCFFCEKMIKKKVVNALVGPL